MLQTLGKFFYSLNLGQNRADALTNASTISTVLAALVAALVKGNVIPSQYNELAMALVGLAVIVIGLVTGKPGDLSSDSERLQ